MEIASIFKSGRVMREVLIISEQKDYKFPLAEANRK